MNKIDSFYIQLLEKACKSGSIELVKYILSIHPEIVIDPESIQKKYFFAYCILNYFYFNEIMLKNAIQSNNINLVKYIFTLNQIDIKGKYLDISILASACQRGNINFVKFLISLDKFNLNHKDVFIYLNLLKMFFSLFLIKFFLKKLLLRI